MSDSEFYPEWCEVKCTKSGKTINVNDLLRTNQEQQALIEELVEALDASLNYCETCEGEKVVPTTPDPDETEEIDCPYCVTPGIKALKKAKEAMK